MSIIKKHITSLLQAAGVTGNIELSTPPKADMGDLAFGCFAMAKEQGKNPAELAAEIATHMNDADSDLLEEVKAFGPYVNFFLNGSAVAALLQENMSDAFGEHDVGKGKHYVVEFACPNPLKAFHLGHLKNLITGESVVRMFENAGYKVTRVNYQGDVGMHVAKALWGIYDKMDEFTAATSLPLKERVEFLGRAYAHGANHFESGEEGKQAVIAFNDKVYQDAEDIREVYTTARQWSLDYFDAIYTRLGSHFDRLYFESEVFERGVSIVKEGQEKEVFRESEGAIIFPGSEYDLHDRVFINSKGFPTYDAKELALAEMHFDDHKPDKVIHVVGKEQTEYFKVAFKALEQVHPETAGKEYHLIGGFLQLKGDQKMSSRKGNIITGDALLDAVHERIKAKMIENDDYAGKDGGKNADAITVAALKYAMLKADVSKDVAFNMEESISTSGDSGPYLLYIVARINSILAKAEAEVAAGSIPADLHDEEKKLLLMLSEYSEATLAAVKEYDPSVVAKYLFGLAQQFNSFYAACPVLQAEEEVKQFRLWLIAQVSFVMTKGLGILGIETVESM